MAKSVDKIAFNFPELNAMYKGNFISVSNNAEVLNDYITNGTLLDKGIEYNLGNGKSRIKFPILNYREINDDITFTYDNFKESIINGLAASGITGTSINEVLDRYGEIIYNKNNNYLVFFELETLFGANFGKDFCKLGVYTFDKNISKVKFNVMTVMGQTSNDDEETSYDYRMTYSKNLIKLAKECNIEYVIDIFIKLLSDDDFCKIKHKEFLDSLSNTGLTHVMDMYRIVFGVDYTGTPDDFKKCLYKSKFVPITYLYRTISDDNMLPIGFITALDGSFTTGTVNFKIQDVTQTTLSAPKILDGTASSVIANISLCTFKEYVNSCSILNMQESFIPKIPSLMINDSDEDTKVYNNTFTKYLTLNSVEVNKNNNITPNGEYQFVNI